MSLAPGYGETPVADEELDALLASLREQLGESVTKAELYDLEQAVQEDVAEHLVAAVLEGVLPLDELLSDHLPA